MLPQEASAHPCYPSENVWAHSLVQAGSTFPKLSTLGPWRPRAVYVKPSETFHTSFPSHGCGSSPGSRSLHSPGRSSEKRSPPPAPCLATGWDPWSNEAQGHAGQRAVGHLAIHRVESRGMIYRGSLGLLAEAEEGGLSPLRWLWRSTEGVASWPTPRDHGR